ncbi:MAG: hypothetical protein HC809_14920, partial [Gammaproteobacteria bacterium]|nr:hypothetical protein [Gammaproteobacteria bacterium]
MARFIYALGIRDVGEATAAEDATQEVLIKILTKLSTFDEHSSLRTWLYRV